MINNEFYTNEGKFKNLYTVLKVNRNSSDTEIRDAYRKLMREVHPDNFVNEPDNVRKAYENIAKEINAAYNILSKRRSAYDIEYDRIVKPTAKDTQQTKSDAQKRADAYAEAKRKENEENERLRQEAEEARYAELALEKYFRELNENGEVPFEDEEDEYERERREYKEQKKRARKLKREARKKKREAEREKRKMKKNKAKADPNAGTVLSKIYKMGHLDAPIRKPRFNWKATIAGVLIVVGLGTGFWALSKNSKNNENKTEPTVPPIENTEINNDITTITNEVYENWNEVGTRYSKTDIEELIKFLNGMESTITADIADEMLVSMLNNALVPGINNAIIGSEEYETNDIDFASLLIDDPAIEAIENMQDNLNGALTDLDNLETYATSAFEDEARIVVEEETVDGFDLTTSSSASKLIWSRLAIGVNGVAGTLGDELNVEVKGNVYTQEDLNNSDIFEEIAKDAKQELGSNSKQMTLN